MRYLVPSLLLLAALAPLEDAGAQLRRRRDRSAIDRSSAQRGTKDRLSLQHDGRTRTYKLHVPARVAQGTSPVPLVIMLHGGGGNADNAELMSGFSPKADREGFIVAYPDGTGGGRAAMFTWNAGHCCGYAMQNKVDDVGFIGALIDQVQRDHRIDPNRIYVTGMSNGGMMSHRVGIGHADRIAAIAPVVGGLFGDESTPRTPVSAIIINGVRDESVPYNGGPSGGIGARAWDGTAVRPAVEQGTFWASAGRCNAAPRESDGGGFTLWQYDCPSPVGVARYAMKDGGHAWPGGRKGSRRGDDPGNALEATDVIWDFFKAHPKR